MENTCAFLLVIN